MLKELQSLALDVRVLDANRNEVQLMETSEYGNTDLNSIISGDKNFAFESNESFNKMGFSKKEFDDASEELVDAQEDETDEDEEDSIFVDDFDDEGPDDIAGLDDADDFDDFDDALDDFDDTDDMDDSDDIDGSGMDDSDRE